MSRVATLIGQLTQLVNSFADRPVGQAVRKPINSRTWRLWVMGVLALILGDHLGLWELHDVLADNQIDVHEIGVIVASIGALLSGLSRR